MTAASIAWAPLVSLPVLFVLGGLALLLVALSIWRRAAGWPWRLAAAAVLLLGLANPSLVEEDRQGLPDVALVVVDDSASQRIGERQAQSEAALAEVTEGLEALPNTEVEVLRAGAGEDGTNLFTAIRDTLSRLPRQQIAGVLLISDGQVHDVPDSLESLAIDAPVHLLLTGEPDEGDRRLVVVRAPSFGIVGRPQELTLRIEDQRGDGAAAGGTATVTISQDGGPPRQLQVPVGQDVPVPFQLSRRGQSILELAVEPGPEELSLANNRAAVVVNGVRERLRVLLISGEPYAGERVWRNILKADPSVDLVHFTILRPPEKQDGTPIRELSLIAFPTRELFEEKLDQFDLVIFDRYRQRGVLPDIYLDNIARYVEEGGALLEGTGPASASPFSLYRTPLARIMPSEPTGRILEEGFRPTLTPTGERHPVTAGLPGAHDGENGAPTWGRWFRLIDASYSPTGGQGNEVVMQGPAQQPLLILARVGQGRVAQLLSDHVWLWARGFEGGGPQAELLRRIAHWLMQEPDLEEEDLRATVNGSRLEITRRSLSPDPVEVEVTLPNGQTRMLRLTEVGDGRQTAGLAIEEPGLYRVGDGTRTALAAAGALNPREFADLRATPQRLAGLMGESRGGSLWLAEDPTPTLRKVAPERDRAGSSWLGILDRESYLVTGVTERALLPSWAYLGLALGAAFLAWRREGR